MNDETFDAAPFRAVMSARGAHVLTVEHGETASGADMRTYMIALERFVRRAGVGSVLFDARRDGAPRSGDEETREARWAFLAATTVITRSAVVADNDLAQMRINMTARARGVTLRAFLDFPSAEKWLAEA